MKPPAFLFDNDGVLVDSSDLHWQAWQKLMEEDSDFHMDKSHFVNSFGKRNDLILKELNLQISEEKRGRLADRKEELFRQLAKENISLIPGIKRFLDSVKKSCIPRIIASSTPIANLEMFVRFTILGSYFDHYLSAEHVEHGKPAPDIFIAAAQQLDFHPADCIVFEDSPAGIASGKAAGSFVVALGTTHARSALSGYDLFFENPEGLDLNEILEAFSTWKNK